MVGGFLSGAYIKRIFARLPTPIQGLAANTIRRFRQFLRQRMTAAIEKSDLRGAMFYLARLESLGDVDGIELAYHSISALPGGNDQFQCIIERAVTRRPKQVNLRLLQFHGLIRSGRSKEAFQQAKTLRLESPFDAALIVATLQRAVGDYSSANCELKHAVDLAGNDVLKLELVGDAFKAANETSQYIDILERLDKLGQSTGSDLRKLAEVYFEDRRFPKLRETLARLARLQPHWARYYELLMQAHLSGQDDFLDDWQALLNDIESRPWVDSSLVRAVKMQSMSAAVRSPRTGSLTPFLGTTNGFANLEATQHNLVIGAIRKLDGDGGNGEAADLGRAYLGTLVDGVKARSIRRQVAVLILAKFHEVLESIGAGTIVPTLAADLDLQLEGPGWQRVRQLIDAACTDYEDRPLLERWWSTLERVSQGKRDFFDIRAARVQQEAFMDLLSNCLREARPLSVLRVGDGESYGFEAGGSGLSAAYGEDDRTREIHWWGREISNLQRQGLGEGFKAALVSADVLGVPGSYRIARDLDLRLSPFSTRRWGRGLQIVMNNISHSVETGRCDPARITFADERLHQAVFNTENIARLVATARKTVVVSCWPRHWYERLGWNSQFHAIQIPPHSKTAGSLEDYQVDQYDGQILPDLIPQLEAELVKLVTPGTLVLVAAGFAGKHMLHLGKGAGGVCLDIGSAADYWHGIKTRSSVDIL